VPLGVDTKSGRLFAVKGGSECGFPQPADDTRHDALRELERDEVLPVEACSSEMGGLEPEDDFELDVPPFDDEDDAAPSVRVDL